MNYAGLKTAIQNYLQNTETTFTDTLDTIIQQAEERILNVVQLPDFRKINRVQRLPIINIYPYQLIF